MRMRMRTRTRIGPERPTGDKYEEKEQVNIILIPDPQAFGPILLSDLKPSRTRS